MNFDFKNTPSVRQRANTQLTGRTPIQPTKATFSDQQPAFDDEDGGVGPKSSPKVHRRRKQVVNK